MAELDARQEQRTKELNALNRLFQTHVSSDLDAREAYEALRQAVSNSGAELERLAERAWLGSRPDSGPPEAVSASLPRYIAPAAGQRS